MTARELRLKYLRFFESKGHTVYPSGSLVPYDVTGRLDESLLFNGAGMVQFKPFFRGAAEPPNRRLVTAQKCVRTGDIETVGDLTHLTFFEMMGNFSFGDYFKKEAVAFSWEFLTSPEWLGLDPHRLAVTVFEEDDVAFDAWSTHLVQAGIDPYRRVFRLGEETNYWPAGAFSSGPPGPCGPNSEMFYWTADGPPPSGPYTREDYLRDEAEGKWLEIWNDVFIQYEWQGRLKNPDRPGEGYIKEGMPDLPFQSIDTGMGLERTIAVLNGLKSVYDSDLFTPIIQRIEELIPAKGTRGEGEARAIRIIADHIRTACFCIADGILPSNTGRGYVLRRLIRRAVLKGLRVLGFDQPFFHLVYEGVVEAMGDHYHELIDRRDVIVETLLNEETQFRRTMHAGQALLGEELDRLAKSSSKALYGAVAFKLYDTYGFPLEVTKELCEEAGVAVDEEGYEVALKEAQERSRGASDMDTVYGGGEERLLVVASSRATPQTTFVGYTHLEHATEIVQISPRFGPDGLTTGEFQLCLAETPFYAESGGQVGDTGLVEGPTFRFFVNNTWKELGMIWHDALLEAVPVLPGVHEDQIRAAMARHGRPATHPMAGFSPEEITEILESGLFFVPVFAHVDAARRNRIIRNHSATHLLHAALREVLGKHVTQAGSLVAPDHLRFDFTHGKAMTESELLRVEAIVNEVALHGVPITIYQDLPIAEARARGAMALFGEKYGDRVRMVEVGDFSRELCGGCHVRQTSEVGLFRIVHESSAASGVRRIEAVTGESAYELVREQSATLRQAAGLLKSTPHDLVHAIERQLESAREERKRRERAEQQLAKGGASGGEAPAFRHVGAVRLWTPRYDNLDPKIAASAIDDAVAANPDLVVVGAIVGDGKVSFVAKVGADALKQGAHAGNLVKEVAKIAGGGGGGRPDFATAGGKDLAKVDEALAVVDGLLQG
ncbi:MAG: alanine--tRNA ligase [Methanoregulaceae archaeon]|nr:alanine--tRNA ligase [Methanoregulaceae archaeon]